MSIIREPIVIESCRECNKRINDLYIINNQNFKCKNCAEITLKELVDILNHFNENMIEISDIIHYLKVKYEEEEGKRQNEIEGNGFREKAFETLESLLKTKIKIIKISDLSVITRTERLVIKDPADPYRIQLVKTAFFRHNFANN